MRFFTKGEPVSFNSSMEAIQAGTGMAYQHFMLIPTLTAADSIILGMEPRKGGLFPDKKAALRQTGDIIEKYHFSIDVEKKISEPSAAEKQKAEIIKTLYRNAEVMILDEPTFVLSLQETEQLFQEPLEFKKNGQSELAESIGGRMGLDSILRLDDLLRAKGGHTDESAK